MASNYDGLTRNQWPGTWSPSNTFPIVLDTEIRGGPRMVTGNSGDRLTDIPGQRIEEGMLVYVKTGYSANGYTRTSETYYQYKLLDGESRNASTGAMPNADANWGAIFGGGPSNTAPTASASGAFWLDSDTGILSVNLGDESNTVWIAISF